MTEALWLGLIISFILLSVFALNCGNGKKQLNDISTSQADSIITSNLPNSQFMILDVRTLDEFNTGHLAGAKNIDIRSADFELRIDSLPKSSKYLVYCRTGHRSANAMNIMKNKGFVEVYNMVGGITKWIEEKRATVQ